jgi:hypothetical protein
MKRMVRLIFCLLICSVSLTAHASYPLEYDPDDDDSPDLSGVDLIAHFERILPTLPFSRRFESCSISFKEQVEGKTKRKILNIIVAEKNEQPVEFDFSSDGLYYTRTLHLLADPTPFADIPDSRYLHPDAPLLHFIDSAQNSLILGKDTVIIDKNFHLTKCSRFDLHNIFL